jgi:hypothetical protein
MTSAAPVQGRHSAHLPRPGPGVRVILMTITKAMKQEVGTGEGRLTFSRRRAFGAADRTDR